MGGRARENGVGIPPGIPGAEELRAIETALAECGRQPYELPPVMELLRYVPRLAAMARTLRLLREELVVEPATRAARGRDPEAEKLIAALEHHAGGTSALRRRLRTVFESTPSVGELATLEAALSAFRRQPYDLSAVAQVSSQMPQLSAMAQSMRVLRRELLAPGKRVPPARAAAAGTRGVRPSGPGARDDARRSRRVMAVGTALLAALVAALAALLVHPGQRQGTGSPAAAFALSISGAHAGQGYASGQVVQLRWKGPVKSAVFRLQIARSLSPELHPFARPPWRTILTDHRWYQLRVVGAQLYYWRVQAFYGASWRAASRPTVFAVARPDIKVPVPLRPRDGSIQRPGRVSLCWSRPAGASAYRLRLDGRPAGGIVRSTCAKVVVRPGDHRWTVAAVVRAAETYTGSASNSTRFVVRAPKSRHARPRKRVVRTPPPLSVVAPVWFATPPTPRPVYQPAPAPRAPVPVYQPAPPARSVPAAPRPAVRRVTITAPPRQVARRHTQAPSQRPRRRAALLPPPPPPVPTAVTAPPSIPSPPPPPPIPTPSTP